MCSSDLETAKQSEHTDEGRVVFVERGSVPAMLSLAMRFGDAAMERRMLRRAAEVFGGLAVEELARLPWRVVAGILGEEGLAVASEDEVYRAAAAYVGAWAQGPEGLLTAEGRRRVWGSVRFGLCSGEVQAALREVAESEGKKLMASWLRGGEGSKRRVGARQGGPACRVSVLHNCFQLFNSLLHEI